MARTILPAFTACTRTEQAELQRRRPLNWSDMGSSAKDLWVARQLRSMRKES